MLLQIGAPKSFAIGTVGFLTAKLSLFTMFVLQPASVVELFSEAKWASVLQEDWGIKGGDEPKNTLIAGCLGELV